jgi:hypothetical protein
MVDDYQSQESAAPFNMAIATLMRISDLFSRITGIQSDFLMSRETKQRLMIDLTRSIFEQSQCLLKVKVAESYLPVFYSLFESNIKQVRKISAPGMVTMTNETRSVYSDELEKTSSKLRMDVLRELKIEGFIMPPRRDLSRAVGDMN